MLDKVLHQPINMVFVASVNGVLSIQKQIIH